MTHAEVNERANRLFRSGLRGKDLEKRIATIREWQRIGLDAEAVDSLILSVPMRVRMVGLSR